MTSLHDKGRDMKIYYDDPSVRYVLIDRVGVATFLREQGLSEERIKRLIIRVRPHVPASYVSEECRAETTLGVSHNNTVVVCTWQHPKDAYHLNNTLLHELYHFATKGKYGPDNYALDYAARPSEVAARQFAETHQHRFLLALEGIPITSSQQAMPPIVAIAFVISLIKLFSWVQGVVVKCGA